MAGRKTLEINPDHTVVTILTIRSWTISFRRSRLKKGNTAGVDTARILSQTAVVESGDEIADPSAPVSRVYKVMSKELGVDTDEPSQEIELQEDKREEDPRGDLDLLDHCTVAMRAQPVPGNEEQQGFSGHIGKCELEQPVKRGSPRVLAPRRDEAVRAEHVEDGWVTVNGEPHRRRPTRRSGGRQDSCVGRDVERQGEGCQEEDSEQHMLQS